ncbi:hypothetical protein [Blastopirellula retiformator]|uniref:hypothetical protein n=1 Tax=Blastopirellula retiformator TaxID=2527970 RepID=UPI0011B6D2C0|nr:hypothetical protein [Blastopirellula retiformator]
MAFFQPNPNESVDAYLSRRIFTSGIEVIVPDCQTDETHEPDGLDLFPSGEIGISRLHGTHDIVYDSISQVLERDALLESRDVEYLGTIELDPNLDRDDILDLLPSHTLYQPASDPRNIIMFCNDSVVICHNWCHYYIPNFMTIRPNFTMRAFGHSATQFLPLARDLGSAVTSFVPCDNPRL